MSEGNTLTVPSEPAATLKAAMERAARRVGEAGHHLRHEGLLQILADELAEAIPQAGPAAADIADWMSRLTGGRGNDNIGPDSPCHPAVIGFINTVEHQSALCAGGIHPLFMPPHTYDRFERLRQQEQRLAKEIWGDPQAFGEFVAAWHPSDPQRGARALVESITEADAQAEIVTADRKRHDAAIRLMAAPPRATIVPLTLHRKPRSK